MTGLAIIVPVLARPHRAVPLVLSAAATTPQPFRLVFVTDPDDELERRAVDDVVRRFSCLDIERLDVAGGYPVKVNAGYRHTTEELLFLGADDLHFHPGWLEAATALLGDRVQVVGTNDLGNPRVVDGQHATHSLVTRRYVDELGSIDGPGHVLHEGYRHNFCDVEFVETAKVRGAWAFAGDSIVEHLHPHWGKAGDDDTYRRGQTDFQRDARLWVRRRQLARQLARRLARR